MKTYLKYAALTLAALVVLAVIICSGTLVPVTAGKSQVPCSGDLCVPTVFTDDAVFQQGKPVPVWGTAPSGTEVTVSFNGQVKTDTASDGEWMVTLDPMAVTSAPGAMTISGGGDVLTVNNVQVGEVWLCSGQSNMWFNLNSPDYATEIMNDIPNHNVSIFRVGFNELTIDKTAWYHADPSNSGSSSAVCYIFAHTISHYIGADVPIGLLQAAKGGTDIVEWTHTAGGSGDGELYDTKIVPMQPYAIRGALWYQGENDSADLTGKAIYYEANLKGLIAEWRADFGQGDFPFGIVQLHWGNGEGWAVVREAELQTWIDVPNTFLGTAVDLPLTGSPGHPDIKEPVGHRCALGALDLVYGEILPYSGPLRNPALSYVQGSTVVVGFDHVGAGLVTTDGQAPGPFYVAGSDDVYHAATAQIVGDTVEVTSGSVPNPESVRYVWSYAQGNMARADGVPEPYSNPPYSDRLPALPFEMDLAGGGPTPTPGPTDTPGPSPTPEPTDTPVPTATPGGATEMHVEDIYTTDVNGTPQDVFSATNKEVIYYRAQIKDQSGAAVEGALVTTEIVWPDQRVWTTLEDTTDADGWGYFSKGTTKPQQKGTYTVRVTGVSKSGATYDPAANVKDSHQFLVE